MGDVALASDEATTQLNTFFGFRVGAYMAEDDTARLVASMFLPEQMEIMFEAILAVVGNRVSSEDGVDRLSMLEDGLRQGITDLRIHCRTHRLKAVLPENKALMATLIDADMKRYCQRLFAAAAAVAKGPPPGIENMPGVVFPTWPVHRRKGAPGRRGVPDGGSGTRREAQSPDPGWGQRVR